MGFLGGVLDEHPGELLTPEHFIQAAAAAGVDLKRLYLIDPITGTGE